MGISSDQANWAGAWRGELMLLSRGEVQLPDRPRLGPCWSGAPWAGAWLGEVSLDGCLAQRLSLRLGEGLLGGRLAQRLHLP